MKKYLLRSLQIATGVGIAVLASFSVTASAQSAASDYVFPVAPSETIELPDGKEVDVYTGTVQHVSGNRLTVRFPGGANHTYVVPPDYRFKVDGRSVRTRDLNRGDELTAYVTKESVHGHEINQVEETSAGVYEIVETITPEPVADSLPATASLMPLMGLLGAFSLSLGALGFGLRRRFGA